MTRRLSVIFLAMAAACLAQPTALDRYVAQKDSVYAWKLVHSLPGDGYKTHVLELTSQTWRTEKDVDRPVWKHWITVVRPDQVGTNKGLLFIGGGRNTDPPPQKPSERTARIAMETRSVVAELFMVPNQPLRFTDSPDKARSEDDTIAYTRVKHFQTKDDTWLLRLAMVKSGVRAMDAIQEFLASEEGGKTNLDHFVVAGGSKRGWTTWLVGAVDRRVVAIMPLVIDALNSQRITRHQFEAYGFFGPALKDYVNHGLFPHKIGTPEYKAVLDIEDPYNYRNRPALKMPKLLINASGDEFFLPDNSRFYFKDLAPEKHIRYVPNSKHNLAGTDAVDTMTAFYESILRDKPRPRFSWSKGADGSIRVQTKDKPMEVKLWQATNPDARDFRVDTIGKAYTASTLSPSGKGEYAGRVEKPAKGFTAFFVELTFPGAGRTPLKLTTEVSVTPDVLPFRWEDAAKKYAGTASGGR
ncbi:MAG: PhoPQ-activated pathogenicity-related family protein [Bryobacteraceae bacterium]|nr:PhoPQ-activated pathogenicity-related family protein [Bryobacteraceae bacterium]